ncbi:hypothetical protein CCR75_006720 [Bremia lactucae]|uniref:PIPK domain-containing protein n=1 Tax=Bremia lactucae TaxID=4779 RepID=A0A976IKS9_BRELC|nr:hypothetical protein CCR75_006720 [Bremia lactucae]
MEVTRWRPFRSSSAPDNAIALQRPLSGASASIQTHLTLSPPSLPAYGSGSLGLDRGSETSSDGGNGISFENEADDFSSPANRSSSGSSLTPRSFGSPTEPLSPRLLDTAAYGECPESVFCKDEGGIYGRDRHGRKNGFVYFLGIIDILQQYNTRKIAETFLKGLRHNRRQISSVNPDFYGDRFIEFVEKHVVQDDTLISSRPLLSPTYATSIVGTSPFKQKNSC